MQLNNSPLPPAHGAPLRALVPGYLGARSVKWLSGLTVSEFESPNHYQRRDYKVLPPQAVDAETAAGWWGAVEAMAGMGVNVGIGCPEEGRRVVLDEKGAVEVGGWATPDGHHRGAGPVVRVEVSGDGGRTWTQAKITEDGDEGNGGGKWSWVLWQGWVGVEKGEGRTILARAFDREGNGQVRMGDGWNLRGVGYNGYGEVGGLSVE